MRIIQKTSVNMVQKYEIDRLDIKIINYLRENARMPFTDLAKKLNVSAGTIHQRYEKLREAGVITGSSIKVNYAGLGHAVTVLLGIHLHNAKDVDSVIDQLSKIDEVVEANYTTGNFALIIKAKVKDIEHFHDFLRHKLQAIPEIRSTESFISLKQVIDKDISLDANS